MNLIVSLRMSLPTQTHGVITVKKRQTRKGRGADRNKVENMETLIQ